MRFNLTSVTTLAIALFVLHESLLAQVLPVDSARQQFQDSVKASIIASSLDTVKPAAPKADEKKNSLTISVELRTRTEFRHGYKAIPTEDTTPAFFTAQRTRLNFAYATKGLDLYLSLQDARVWGTQDPRNPLQPSYLFEAYAEPHFSDKFSVRVGRQRVIYDNQRLFAENDWRTQGSSHDAIRFIYSNKINFTTELLGAYNQSAENTFGDNYKPSGFAQYKSLVSHYLNWKMSKNFTLTTLNVMDGYQSSVKATTTYNRFTSGGRIEFGSYKWYFTF